jgi:hypothetical protein
MHSKLASCNNYCGASPTRLYLACNYLIMTSLIRSRYLRVGYADSDVVCTNEYISHYFTMGYY